MTPPGEDPALLVLSTPDFLWFVDLALDEMTSIVSELGDDVANRRPDLRGSNSAYAILTHCLGVIEYWGGYVVAGRPIERDRDAEFRAEGSVAALTKRAAAVRRRLATDLSTCEPTAPPRNAPAPEDAALPLGKTQGGVLFHIYEELAQHLGQLQLTRDVLRAGTSSAPGA